MISLADASTIAPGWPGWCLIAAAILFLAACALIHNANRSPVTGPDTSNLDHRDGIATRCVMAHCSLAGTIERTTVREIGLEVATVCPGHSDEGDRKGWWVV